MEQNVSLTRDSIAPCVIVKLITRYRPMAIEKRVPVQYAAQDWKSSRKLILGRSEMGHKYDQSMRES